MPLSVLRILLSSFFVWRCTFDINLLRALKYILKDALILIFATLFLAAHFKEDCSMLEIMKKTCVFQIKKNRVARFAADRELIL